MKPRKTALSLTGRGRSCGDRLDAAPNDRVRFAGDSQSEGEATRSQTIIGPTIERASGVLSAWRGGW